MPRNLESEKMTKHTLFLFAGDFDRLGAIYADVGASAMLRRILRDHLDRIESRVTPTPELKLEQSL